MVPPKETRLSRIARLRRNLERADERAKQAREAHAEASAEAHEAGESPTLIAHVAGYTVQRVHQIVRAAKKGGGGRG